MDNRTDNRWLEGYPDSVLRQMLTHLDRSDYQDDPWYVKAWVKMRTATIDRELNTRRQEERQLL